MEKTRSASSQTQFRYYDLVMAAFVTILLLSNLIGASKPSYVTLPFIGEWSFGAGVLFFPVSYIIGDVLTEVYGYARARRVIWTGFAALLFMAFMAWVVVQLPPAAGWPGQAAYEFVFGNSWRIVLASMTAFWAGEFANSRDLCSCRFSQKSRGRGSLRYRYRFFSVLCFKELIATKKGRPAGRPSPLPQFMGGVRTSRRPRCRSAADRA